jgi:Ran GTPase-activating protein (RanGAP) involved in mRNA processing and transport
LRVIKIENAGITDLQVATLTDSLMASDKPHMLIELSLAINHIGDYGAEKLAAFLDYGGNQLKVLNLHWNKIKFKGGLRIAEVLEHNEILRILDLSWNLLGQWT